MTFFEDQLKEHNVELTVVSYCYLILLIPSLMFVPKGINSIYIEAVNHGSVSSAIWDSYEMGVMSLGLNIVGYLMVVLAIWVLLNAVQLICLYFDRNGSEP